MQAQATSKFHEHLTQRANLKNTRYGWLRLTPAYSVHLVSDLLDSHHETNPVVLDPFCGTGTTALVCAERGIESDTTDINPFLIWLGTVKTRNYEKADISEFDYFAEKLIGDVGVGVEPEWLPEIHQIDKWWDWPVLTCLSQLILAINELDVPASVSDLLKIAFCRVMIEQSNASFSHQSMSLKKKDNGLENGHLFNDNVFDASWKNAVSHIRESAQSLIERRPNIYRCDARELSKQLEKNYYSCVITSPPYPNRMSYIRELRPYMYWLGFLETATEASELDWEAIGGTWGFATSRVGKWVPEKEVKIPFEEFQTILFRIAQSGDLLSRYVHKYFYDMKAHVDELFKVVRPGGRIHYIVGNSKFYDVVLPVEHIFAALFESVGFIDSEVKTIRKRSSKKELFEFVVTATK